MDKKITNKRVDLNDIVHIAEMMNMHCLYYKEQEAIEKRRKEELRDRNEIYTSKYYYGNIRFSIQYNDNETITKENDLDWFRVALFENPQNISDISISFSGSEEDTRENLRIEFTPNKIYYDTSITNRYDNPLSNMVEGYISTLPVRFDTLVEKDTRRIMVPALTISIPLGIIAAVILLVLGKMNILSSSIAGILTHGITLTIIMFSVAFFGAVLIPTKNTSLYKNIKIETYYAGFNYKTLKSIRRDDYDEFKSKCEIAIGTNANMPAVRQSIEENYKKAKKVVAIETLIAVLAVVIFFVL